MKLKQQKGFTLVELVVVFALLGLMMSAGVSAFSVYNSSQGIQVAAADVSNILITAKSRAISQASPPQCAGKSLQGYSVVMVPGGSQFSLQATCSGVDYALETHNLPPDVVFAASSVGNIFFNTSSGAPRTTGVITINGKSKVRTLTVQATGNIVSN